ncbi:unnamed protein product, partial [Rotaria sp. Silwood1]
QTEFKIACIHVVESAVHQSEFPQVQHIIGVSNQIRMHGPEEK